MKNNQKNNSDNINNTTIEVINIKKNTCNTNFIAKIKEGIIHIDNFIANAADLFNLLIREVNWDETMTARKTASYGKAYNYSHTKYNTENGRISLTFRKIK